MTEGSRCRALPSALALLAGHMAQSILVLACGAQQPRNSAPPPPAPSHHVQSAEPEALLRTALVAESNANLETAESMYLRATAEAPERWVGWLHLARVQLLQGKHTDAQRNGEVARETFARATGSSSRVVHRGQYGTPLDVEWLGDDWLGVVDGIRTRLLVFSREAHRIVAELEIVDSAKRRRTPQINSSHVVSTRDDDHWPLLIDLATMQERHVRTSEPVVWHTVSPNGAWLGSYEAWGATVQSLDERQPPVRLSLLGGAEASFAEKRCQVEVDPDSALWTVSLLDAGGSPMPDVPYRASMSTRTLSGRTDVEGRVELPRNADFLVHYGDSPYDPADPTAPEAFDYVVGVSTRDEPGECYNTRYASQVEFLPNSQAALLWGEGGTRLYSLPKGKLVHDWAVRVGRSFGFSADARQFLYESSDPEPDTLYRLDLDSGAVTKLNVPNVINAGWIDNRIATVSETTLTLWDRELAQQRWSTDLDRVRLDTMPRGNPDGSVIAVAGESEITLYETATGRVEATLREETQPGLRAFFSDDGRLSLCGLHWCRHVDIEQLTASAAAQLPPPVADVEREWRRELALSPKGLHWAASGARSAKFASDSSVVVPPSLEKAHWVDESGGLAVRTEDGSLCRWTWDAGSSAMVMTATSVRRVELLDVSANGTVALVRRPSGEVEAWSADSLSPLRQVRASSEEGCSRYHCSMTPQLQQVRISRFQARASRSSSWRLGAA